jgi:hypothetical protein
LKYTASGKLCQAFWKVADLLLEYDPQGNYSTIALLTIALWRVFVGHFLRTSTRYPQWSVLSVPTLGSLIITGVYESHIVPLLGNILFPTVLSLPHLIFFLLSTIVLFNKTR